VLAAVPSIGRATAIEPRPAAPEAELTRDLYERYHRQIFAYCLHQLNSREEAEDATQTTFMNAFRGLQRGVVPELESAWLFKIANNVILTRRRSSYRRRRVETPGDLDAIQDLLPSPQRDADELIRLTEALSGMPEQQRKALLLREWQGLSYREIGEQLGLTQAAVETLLFRARRSLANGLTDPEAAPKKRRLLSGIDAGCLLAGLKGLLSGGAAVKVAVTAAAVATSAVVAADPPGRRHLKPEGPVPTPAALATPSAVAAPPAHAGAARVELPAPAGETAKPVSSPRLAGTKPRTIVGHAVRRHSQPVVGEPAPVAVAAPIAAAVEQPRPVPVAVDLPSAPEPIAVAVARPAPTAPPEVPRARPASGKKARDRTVKTSERTVPVPVQPFAGQQAGGGANGHDNEQGRGRSRKVEQPTPVALVRPPTAHEQAPLVLATSSAPPVVAPPAEPQPGDGGYESGHGRDKGDQGGKKDR
jgi:RNA polymerase sigma factor (sigma-70 family)